MKKVSPPLPYSKAIKSGNLLFVSGHIGLDPKTNELAADIKSQAVQTMENLKSTLKDKSINFKNVVKTTVFLKNMADYPVMNEVYARYFQSPYPVRSSVAVSALPRNALIEIELIAYLGEKSKVEN